MNRFSKLLNNEASPKIIDIATGSGQFIHLITEACDHYESILGIDTHTKALDHARKTFADKRITFKEEDIFNIKGTYDIVCLSNSLHHFKSPRKILDKMVDLTGDKGLVVIGEMIKDGQNDKQMTHVGLHHFWARIDRLTGGVHEETYDKAEILELLNRPDLKLIETWDFDQDRAISSEDMAMLKKSVSTCLKRVEGHETYEELKKTGAILDRRLEDIGFELATKVMVFLKKC